MIMARFRVIAIHNNPPNFWGFVLAFGFSAETDCEAEAISVAHRYNRCGSNPRVDRFVVVNIETGEIN